MEPDFEYVDHGTEVLLDEATLGTVQQVMSPPMMAQLVEVMERTSRETLTVMEKGAAAGDLHTLQRAAHKLKGSAGNLGMRRLWRASTNLEASDTVDEARRLVEILPALFEDSMAAIRAATQD